jgi:hypothetical protein
VVAGVLLAGGHRPLGAALRELRSTR